MNPILSVSEYSLSGEDTIRWWRHSNLNCHDRICLNFALRDSGDAKALLLGPRQLVEILTS